MAETRGRVRMKVPPLLGRVLRIVATVVVTWFILRAVGLGAADLRALDLERWRPVWWLFAVSCLVAGAGYVVSGLIWGRMVRDLGGRLSGPEAVRIFFVASLGRYVPGKLWQIAGLAALATRRGVAPAVSVAAAVWGQALSLVGCAVVAAFAFARRGEGLSPPALAFALVLAVALVVMLVPRARRGATRAWFRLARRPELAVAVGTRATLRWGGLYVVNWALYGAAFALLAASFELPVGSVEAASIFAAGYLLGYVAFFAPAGLGVREGSLVYFLAPALGVGPATATAVTARLWTTGIELLPAAWFWLRAGRAPGEVPRV